MKIVGLLIIAVALIGGVIVGGWQLSWWAKEEAVNRGAEIRQDSFARQTALLAEVLDLYGDITRIDSLITFATVEQAKPLQAQRLAIEENICAAWLQINDKSTISGAAARFAGGECS